MNKTKIPSNIDVSKIINKVEELYNGTKSKTEIVNIKDCSFLLIHFLIPDSKYLEETKHDNYFKKIFSTIFNEKYGKTFSDVKAVLFDDAYPVIETDGTNYTDNRSTRYKLKDEFFFNQATKLVEGTGKYIQKYNNYVKDKKQKNNQFQFLSDRLSKRITLDSAVYSYMSQLFDEFETTIATIDKSVYDAEKFKLTLKIIKLKFANDLENIENGNYNDGTSMTNQRFNSVFTGLKRELRHFIRIDGELVDEIDATASQPYFLNRILTSEFFNGKKQGSLCFIFPELYKEFISSKKKIKVDTHNLNYVWDVNTTNTTKFKSNISEILNKGVPPVFYLSGKIENICDIREFGSILYLFDFYEFILQDVKFMMEQTNVQRKEILKGRLSKIDRKHAKTGMMFFINDKYHRNHNNFVKAMKTAYPNVNLIVEFLQNIDFGSAELNKKFENPFSLLIQRIEAYHFLRIGVKGFCDRFENEPLITIHDSVIVKKSVSDEMRKCLHTFIEKETGIPMGLSTKAKNPFITIKELVNEYLQECKVAKKVRLK